MFKKIILFLVLLSIPMVLATAPCRIPFQASGFKLANGSLITSASVSTYVYVDPSGGSPIYSETWASGLQNGYVSVTMGNDTTGNPLNLNWGQSYWLAVNIDGTPITMLDGYGISSARQAFVSTQGEIVQLTQVNASIVTQTSRIDILNSTIISLNNLSLTNISSNLGNWSADKPTMNNLSYSQISTNLGNWTLDKPNYATIAYANAISNLTLPQIVANIGNWTLDKSSYALSSWVTGYVGAMNNLSLSQIVSNIGNWTLDKSTLNNLSLSQITANIGNFSAENSTIVRNGTKSCPTGQVLMNVTGNSSGFYGDCVVASSSSGFQTNASIGAYYNKTTTTYAGSLTSGTLVGYLAGNAICNASFLGTHFCTQEEVMETIWHMNISTMSTWTGDAWVSSGAPKYAPAPTPVNDCNGWTSAVASSYLGNYWHFSTTGGGYGATINCGTSIALACCGVG